MAQLPISMRNVHVIAVSHAPYCVGSQELLCLDMPNSDRLRIATDTMLGFGSIQDTAPQSSRDVGVSYNLAR